VRKLRALLFRNLMRWHDISFKSSLGDRCPDCDKWVK
jgi:hypothetical protein